MVHKSITLLARARGGDAYWYRRRILSLSAHFFGRRKNCKKLAKQAGHRQLRYATLARKRIKQENKLLWETRLMAGCEELGTTFEDMKDVTDEMGIALDRKILQNLAIYEPRSFKSLAFLTMARQKETGLQSLQAPLPSGVITKGMLGTFSVTGNTDIGLTGEDWFYVNEDSSKVQTEKKWVG